MPQRRPPRPLAKVALVAAAAVLVAGCGLSSSPSAAVPTAGASPSTAAGSESAGASEWPDTSPDLVEPSPSVPAYRPPSPLPLAPGAAGLVLHVPVLMYHRVIPRSLAGDSLPSLVVPPDLFAAQMDALAAAGWHTITAAELYADLAANRRPAPKTFVITFDDGYDDGYTYALPILRAHGFVATFYVIAGRIGNPPGPLEALTPEHVRALAAAGMEIGDHTYSHVDIAGLDPTLLRYQVVAAAARIEQLIGTPPLTFAYPFGRWSLAAAAAVLAAGMGLAFTTVEGAREAWPTRFESPRVRVGPATSPAELLSLAERFSL